MLLAWLTAVLVYNRHLLFVEMTAAGRGDQMTEICQVVERAPLPPGNRGNAVLLVAQASQAGLVPLVRHYYPEASEDPVYDGSGHLFMRVFTVSTDVIERTHGLRATFRSPGRTWTVVDGSDRLAPPNGAALPLDATWRGLVSMAAPGPVGFRATGGTLRVDGVVVGIADPRLRAAGWHAIEFAARFTQATDRGGLEWQLTGAEQWEPIPRTALQTHPDVHGLLGRYYSGLFDDAGPSPLGAEPPYARIEAALSFDWLANTDEPPPP